MIDDAGKKEDAFFFTFITNMVNVPNLISKSVTRKL